MVVSLPALDVRGRRAHTGANSTVYEQNGIEWYTPPGIFEALGVSFDVDVCAPKEGLSWIPAARSFSIEDEGLTQPWVGRVWMNPPYGRQTGDWMHRLADHGNGIALVFARVDTGWWHDTVSAATLVCFIRGRLSFVDRYQQPAPSNANAPSALVAYGRECAEAVARAGLGMMFAVNTGGLEELSGGEAS